MTREGREGGEASGQARGAAHKMEGPRSPTQPHAAPRGPNAALTQPHAAPCSPCERLRAALGWRGSGVGDPKRIVGFCCESMVRPMGSGVGVQGNGGQEEGGGHKEVVMRSGVLFWEVGLWTPILSPQLTGVTERPSVMSGVLPVPTFLCWVCGWKAEPASSSGRERMAPSKPF